MEFLLWLLVVIFGIMLLIMSFFGTLFSLILLLVSFLLWKFIIFKDDDLGLARDTMFGYLKFAIIPFNLIFAIIMLWDLLINSNAFIKIASYPTIFSVLVAVAYNIQMLYYKKEYGFHEKPAKKLKDVTKSNEDSFVEKNFVSWKRKSPLLVEEKIGMNIEEVKQNNIFDDFEVYDREPKQAICNFIEQMYARKYKSPEDKGKDFELFVGKFFELSGYEVSQQGIKAGRRTDHGIDVIAKKNDEIIMLQCKHNIRDWKLEEKILRDFLGSLTLYDYTRAVLLTTGSLSKNLNIFAKKVNEKGVHIEVYGNSMRWGNLFRFFDSLNSDLLKELGIEKSDFKKDLKDFGTVPQK